MRRRDWEFFAAEIAEGGAPRLIEDAMADLAITFHWSPAVMDEMSVSELLGWREHAARRSRPPEKPGKR
ncbi:GpE family phage tail protein [Sphingobium sp. B10D3B]|uniref:GpE family phage tail protein n=1 Tax=Sphingobium sp. B10D3B TaxID=2940572 RepID=UPI0039B6CC07